MEHERPPMRRRYPLMLVLAGIVCGSPAEAEEPSIDQPGRSVDHGPKPDPEPPAELQFDSRMLWGSGSEADLSRFAQRNILRPGQHRVDVSLNDQRSVPMRVTFVPARENPNTSDAQACFTAAQLEQLGVNFNALSPELNARLGAGDCVGVREIYDTSTEAYDFSSGQLAISVPQAYLFRLAEFDVQPSQWESGITAFRSNYSYSLNRYQYADQTSSSFSILLNNGLNFGGWYLRNSSYVSHYSSKTQFTSQRTTLQTDIPSWRARLLLGQLFMSSEYFSSYQLNGAMISTDPGMLPYSERMYRPTIRGVASTAATVRILQANSVVYQGNVAPGPFAIDDYSPMGYGGDLTVLVTEADGSTHRFVVPFGNAVRLIRRGQLQYSASLGRFENRRFSVAEPWVTQLSTRWGAADGINLYGGVLNGQDAYSAGLIGLAVNTPIGAVSGDVALARSQPAARQSFLGTGYRLSYSKTLEPTRTSLRLASTRYSSEGFYTLNETLSPNRYTGARGRPRSEVIMSLNQPIQGIGSLYVSGSWRNYWHSSHRRMQWDVTYGTAIKQVGVSVSASYSNDRFGSNRQVMVNLGIPLGSQSMGGALRASYIDERGRGATQRLSYSGVAGEERSISYGIDAARSTTREMSYGLSGSYLGRYGQISGNVLKQADATQLAVNGDGGLVIHGGGVTLGHLLPDSIGLIDARDAGGAMISNMGNASLDSRGYGLVGLSPYSINEVQISPENLSLDVELQSSQERAIPRSGAVVPLVFKTRREVSALLTVDNTYRDRLPFGSPVTDGQGNTLGTVGQGGRALVRGLPPAGVLVIKLSDGTTCLTPYQLSETSARGAGGLPSIPMKCETQS